MKANFKKYISIVLAVCLLMALVSLVACQDKEDPKNTQPSESNQTTTTPEQTTPTDTGTTPPEVTTPEKPAETTPVFPSDEDSDPRQEDVFFD